MTVDIENIINIQDELNTHTISKEWRSRKDIRWDFAIITEVAELLDSVGLKWWKNTPYSIKDYDYAYVVKHTDIDIENIHVELVDLLHFVVSYELTLRSDKDFIIKVEHAETKLPQDGCNIDLDKLNILTRAKMLMISPNISNLYSLVKACGLSRNKLYSLYVGKNILNMFRQEHGYKAGEYKKLWHGSEDNKVMYRLVMHDNIDTNDLYDKLEEVYSSV